MQRIVVRAPACGADAITFLKRVLRIRADELRNGERVELVFDGGRFPFAAAIFESLIAGAGLSVVGAREEDGARVFEVEKV